MALDTLRANKMRSALTVLGVVIGITSIVGMTSLIRGFDHVAARLDQRARAARRSSCQASARSASRPGASFVEMIAAPGPHGRRRRSDQAAGAVGRRSSTSGSAPAPPQPTHGAGVLSRRAHPAGLGDRDERALRRHQLREAGRRPRLHRAGSRSAASAVVVIGYGPYAGAVRSSGHRSDRQEGARSAPSSTRSSASSDKRPAAGGFSLGQDDFAIIPYTAYRKQFGSEKIRTRAVRRHRRR